MKVLFVGDFKLNTGPALANKLLVKGINEENKIITNQTNKFLRIVEFIFKIFLCTDVCFCSFSKFNKAGIRVAKLFKKNVYYIMHGYKSYEYQMNSANFEKSIYTDIKKLEKYIFSEVDRIFCVSQKFKFFMQQEQPTYSHKFDYNYNGIDTEIYANSKNIRTSKKERQIMSVGGGMPQKNNLTICKAIELLNDTYNMNLSFIVVGNSFGQKETFKKYDFVDYYEKLPHGKVISLMLESQLYIQNSIFESFGLSIIEAMMCNCELLISEYVGALDLLDTLLDEEDIIFDVYDYREIAKKIKKKIENPKEKDLEKNIDIDSFSYKVAGKELILKIAKSREDIDAKVK